MIMTYCIYNQYKIRRKKNSICWLCGFNNEKCSEYETTLGNYINLHEDCFKRHYEKRKYTNYKSLSIIEYKDYHCLNMNTWRIYSIYNNKYIKFLSYEEDKYIPYPNVIKDPNFHNAYKNWALKYLAKINIPKLLYFKKYLNHNDIFMYIEIIFSKVLVI